MKTKKRGEDIRAVVYNNNNNNNNTEEPNSLDHRRSYPQRRDVRWEAVYNQHHLPGAGQTDPVSP